MIRRDRELFAKVARVNQAMGAITLALVHLTPDDAEFAKGLRDAGIRFAELGADLVQRADELDGRIIDGTTP